MKTKKIPLRTCVACRTCKDKRELTRIVKNKDGEIFLDESGKSAGRGAYVCKDIECIRLLKKRKILNKVFETDVSEKVYDKIESEFINAD